VERTKIVARYKDNRVLKGYTEDFDPTNPVLLLFPPDKPRPEPVRVMLDELKAMFFVRDLDGNPTYQERKEPTARKKPVGRLVKVTFRDGETLVGSTLEYDPRSVGFSLFPIDLRSNNVRVFVINSAVRRVTDIPFQKAPGPLWILLTTPRRILPVSERYNPVLSSWWALVLILALTPFAGIAVTATTPTPSNVEPLEPLSGPAPKFASGTIVEVRAEAIGYAAGEEPTVAMKQGETLRGIVLDFGWSQGRWLYRLGLGAMGQGWAFEDNLRPVAD
jgi:hypothetical protein